MQWFGYNCDIIHDERAKLAKGINIQPKESRVLHVTLHATIIVNTYSSLVIISYR